ncbi:A1 protein [Rhizobium phage RHph_Y48]|uniref:A1 protein n=1 Tax=Rhizobium phage RHph_Y1_20 TaxID=2509571 RepID=A0A7S5URW7_9CAUD|nr:A1 protein [Rhizobium phage RHph_Y1_20]QIG69962.1 A1 protein [Rhizobium phage RHph_Y48]QIG70014.1 A1 protein [Rhizobium phage RHph_Y86]QIG70066.1 putative A1 protein [Rhizobium phage RHph_Y2_7]
MTELDGDLFTPPAGKPARKRGRPKGSKNKPKPNKAPAVDPRPIAGGSVADPSEKRERLEGRRFILTSAQNNTNLHEDFWNALQTFATERSARLLVSRFTYNKNAWRNASSHNEGVNATEDSDGIWYDPRIAPYQCDRQVKIADDLVFCGELDILPTAATPLESLRNYTGPNSGIIPHAKVHMVSQATMLDDPAKFLYSTGAATLRNYIDRKAGQVATFHHTFAALYVEVDDDGHWFARQLIADDNGVFYDLDRAYGPGWSRPATDFGDTIVTLGDIHVEKVDAVALAGAIEMTQFVKAKYVTVHDLIDFTSRNHHNINDPYFLVQQHFQGVKSVESGMAMGARLLAGLHRALPDAQLLVIRSNHDQAFERWLKNKDGFSDPINAPYWCLANASKLNAIRNNKELDVFVWAMHYAATIEGFPLKNARFIQEDESVVINDIEHGMHGHRGPNGAKGNPKSFRQMGRKVNTAHTHSAGIIDGVWTAGTLSLLRLGYNAGPSSWSQSSIITYPSGKRAIVTQRGPKWRAA